MLHRRLHSAWIWNHSVICLFLAISGCWSSPPQFRLNTEGRDPQSISPEQASAITDTLEKIFGTPDKPAVPDGIDLSMDLLKMAAGPIGSDAQDRPWGLFRKHCVACHGLSGDGAGTNAAALDPYPRDYRYGVFKFTSTVAGAKPTRQDLIRTLRKGIPGTAMPSFSQLPDGQIDALVEYVKYLSIRGETELYLLKQAVDENAELPLDTTEVIKEGVQPIAKSWTDATNLTVNIPPPQSINTVQQLSASIARGRELFRTMGAQCFQCHGWVGKGDGERWELYDDWNIRKKGATPVETKELANRFQLPIQSLQPRDLTDGLFRGGNRPADIYMRISAGIKGTPMTGAGPTPSGKGAIAPEDIWHMVNYVISLSKKGSEFGIQGSAFER